MHTPQKADRLRTFGLNLLQQRGSPNPFCVPGSAGNATKNNDTKCNAESSEKNITSNNPRDIVKNYSDKIENAIARSNQSIQMYQRATSYMQQQPNRGGNESLQRQFSSNSMTVQDCIQKAAIGNQPLPPRKPLLQNRRIFQKGRSSSSDANTQQSGVTAAAKFFDIMSPAQKASPMQISFGALQQQQQGQTDFFSNCNSQIASSDKENCQKTSLEQDKPKYSNTDVPFQQYILVKSENYMLKKKQEDTERSAQHLKNTVERLQNTVFEQQQQIVLQKSLNAQLTLSYQALEQQKADIESILKNILLEKEKKNFIKITSVKNALQNIQKNSIQIVNQSLGERQNSSEHIYSSDVDSETCKRGSPNSANETINQDLRKLK